MKHFSKSMELRWGIIWSVSFLIALSWIPYRIPGIPTVSPSYLFGYNNRAAEAIVALAMLGVALYAPRLNSRPVSAKPLSRSTLCKALLIAIALGSVFFLVANKMDGYGESIYLIDRLKLVLEGRLPYRDFEYAYGAAFLYIPAMLVRWLGLSAASAYLSFWVFCGLLGIFLLHRTILWIDEFGFDRRRVFLGLWLSALLPLTSTGVNYSVLRFILSGFFAVWIERRLKAAPTPRNEAVTVLLCIPLFALILLISPEMALSFAFGITVYLIWSMRARLSFFAIPLLLAVAGMGLLGYAAFRLGAFGTLLAFRDGGMNFPLVPAPHLLLFFLCLSLVVAFAAGEVRAGRSGGMLALVAASAVSLAAAFGRCDSSHVLFNAIDIWIVGALLATTLPAWRHFLVAIIVVFVALPMPHFLHDTAAGLVRAALPMWFAGNHRSGTERIDRWLLTRMTAELGQVKAREKFDNFRVLGQMQKQVDLPQVFHLPESTVFAAPFSLTLTRFGIYHAPSVDDGYYEGILNVMTPSAIQTKIAELEAHPERPLLLLQDAENSCGSTSAQIEEVRTAIRQLFVYPYTARAVHRDSPLTPFCRYIKENYRQAQAATPEHFGYALWIRRND